jgi:hypothetical protein
MQIRCQRLSRNLKQQHKKKVVILSDSEESSTSDKQGEQDISLSLNMTKRIKNKNLTKIKCQ